MARDYFFNSITFFLYYHCRPIIPRYIQILLRRIIIKLKKDAFRSNWPINEIYCKLPDGWKGWPEQKQFALVLTHDVEDYEGLQKCIKLAELEKKFGFRSVFNFVPKKYKVTSEILNYLKSNGFEIGVHGLYHDGKLYRSRKIFRKRAAEINKYLAKWGCVGFRAPSMHHNLDWNCYLNIEYDASTFDIDPFEPQSDGIGTIFPVKIEYCKFKESCKKNCSGYIELPYTLPQDFALFVLMKEKNINIWKQKIDWIFEKGGLALLNTHPDYMNFGNGKSKFDEYPYKYYKEFLEYIKINYEDKYWHVLPKEIALFWDKNY